MRIYLGNARKTKTIKVSELSDVISKITGVKKPSCDEDLSTESSLKPGEHVAVYWVEENNTVVWYLGIVEEVSSENIAKIIHLKRSDKKEHNWIIPDEPEKLNVMDDQIMARDICVIFTMACPAASRSVKLLQKTSQTVWKK